MAFSRAPLNGFGSRDAVVVVAGAASGIGLSIAQESCAASARVALGDLHRDGVEQAASALGGSGVFSGAVDMRAEASTQAFFADADRALGPVTVAVANAGAVPNCLVLDMPVEKWER